MTLSQTRLKGLATSDPTLPPPSPQEPHTARPSGDKSPIYKPGSGPVSTYPIPGLEPQFHSHQHGYFHAKVYLEWGTVYDVRNVAFVFWENKYSVEDMTGGAMILHQYLREHATLKAAKAELMRFVFSTGEEHSFIDFGASGIVRKCDPATY